MNNHPHFPPMKERAEGGQIHKFSSIFTNDRVILGIIIFNSIIIFMQECGISSPFINLLDALCTAIFTIEMCLKIRDMGIKGYLDSWWNWMDGILVIISLPTLIYYFMPHDLANLSFLKVLRILRVFRFFRMVKVFPHIEATAKGLGKALRDCLPIVCGFVLMILIFALISCVAFRDISPEYFGTPWLAIYSTFRMCTVEGWYEIPDSMELVLSPMRMFWVRAYFVFILIVGGIVGLSLVNSIFVDAMVDDNNDELEREVSELNKKVDNLTEMIDNLLKEKIQ